jgi:hypothetical protein
MKPPGVWPRRPIRTLRRGGRIPPESQGWTYCPCFASIIIRLLREKPSGSATFATFAPASREH